MRRALLGVAAFLLLAVCLRGQTAEEIINKYLKTVGGAQKIQSIKTLVRTGRISGGGGFEVKIRQENKRPNLVREEITMQAMTGVTAYDGKTGWKIEPWGGKKDPESLGEEEMKGILEDADFDGPIVNYEKKGHKVKYLGTEPVEGTDALKLEVTLANGDTWTYYMDTDYYVPIKADIKRMVRGEEHEYEMSLGDYKEVDGWYLPHSVETSVKGSEVRGTVTYERIEANVPINDSDFAKPAMPAKIKQ
jgi:outer membrane lipoprotein-sorting protein